MSEVSQRYRKVAGQFTDATHLEAAQGMAFATTAGGLLVALP